MTARPTHQQRNAYRLTAEEAGALLWYRSLPFLVRRCLCSFVLRLTAGMGAEDAARLYRLEAGAEQKCFAQQSMWAGHRKSLSHSQTLRITTGSAEYGRWIIA